MNYSDDYLSVFNTQRVQLDEELFKDYLFMDEMREFNHHHSWNFISIVADALTAYNELCTLDFFVSMKFFKPNY